MHWRAGFAAATSWEQRGFELMVSTGLQDTALVAVVRGRLGVMVHQQLLCYKQTGCHSSF